MAVAIALCGLVRDHERLTGKLKEWTTWREKGLIDRIVYATWIGEIDRYKGLRQELDAAGVELAEIEEPVLVLKAGHQLHQMAAFHYALSLIPDPNQYVLKTRVDLCGNTDLMFGPFTSGTPLTDDFLKVGIERKILIENAQMLFPFLCADPQFFGRKADLLKMVNFSNEMEFVFNRLAVEQAFFFQPFKSARTFREHFYWNVPHISEIKDEREAQVSFLLEHPKMFVAVKCWWLILSHYFKIGWGDSVEDFQVAHFGDAFLFNRPGIKTIHLDSSDPIFSQQFLDKLVSMIPDEDRAFLMQQMKDTNEAPFSIDSEKFEIYDKFRRRFTTLTSAKAAAMNSRDKRIRGSKQQFFVKDDGANQTYHTQKITELRRTILALEHQLADASGSKQLKSNRMNSMSLHYFLKRMIPPRAVRYIRVKLPYLFEAYLKIIFGNPQN